MDELALASIGPILKAPPGEWHSRWAVSGTNGTSRAWKHGFMEVLSSRTIIITPDLERSRAFYQNTLGLNIYREYGSAGVATGIVFFLGGGFLELSNGPATTVGEAVKLWLQVADLGAEEERLRSTGVVVRKPAERMPWGLDEMWIEDPHGVEICLVEVPPEHPLRRRVD